MKKNLVSVSGSAPSKMAQAPCGCPHTRDKCSRGGRGGVGLCVLWGAPAVCHVPLGKESGRGWLLLFLKVPVWEQAYHALSQLCWKLYAPNSFHHWEAMNYLPYRCTYPSPCREESCRWGCGVLPGAFNLLWGEACRWAPARQRDLVPPSLAPLLPAFSTTLKIRSCHTITTVRWSVLLSWT